MQNVLNVETLIHTSIGVQSECGVPAMISCQISLEGKSPIERLEHNLKLRLVFECWSSE